MLFLITKFFSGDFIFAIRYASLSNFSLLDLLVVIVISGFVIQLFSSSLVALSQNKVGI